MVADLNFPLHVVVVSTVREADGLALSSRNMFLSEAERAAAPIIFQALHSGAQQYADGQRDPDLIRTVVRDHLARAPLAEIEYVSIVDRETMAEPVDLLIRPGLIAVAVRFGNTRLIDNWPLG